MLIEGEWVKAELMERGLATSTYESVVSRRRDPLLFVKESDTRYDFKIYPLFKNTPRSMRFSYILPLDFSGSSLALYVDNQFKKVSAKRPLVNALVVVDNSILELTNKENIVVTKGNNNFSCDLNGIEASSLVFQGTTKENKDFVLKTAKYKKENYYNLSISPDVMYKNKLLSNKYVVVLDRDPKARNYIYQIYDTVLTYYTSYDGSNTYSYSYYPLITKDSSISNPVFLSETKKLLINTLKETDSVCFIYSDSDGKIVRSEYLQASQATIENILGNITITTCDYSVLYEDIFTFTNTPKALNSHVIVISNNTSYSNLNTDDHDANINGAILATKLDSISNRNLKLTIFSLQSHNGYVSSSSNGFYTTLSSLSKGSMVNCKTVADLSSPANISLIQERSNDNILSVTVKLKANNGVLYNEFTNVDEVMGKNKPCILAGKFSKVDSFTLDLVIESVDSVYIQQYNIPNSEITTDTIVYTGWAIEQINKLENELFVEKQQMINDINNYYYYYDDYNYSPQYLNKRQEIITSGIDHSILSTETAFLSLERGMVVEGCKDCANPPSQNNWDKLIVPVNTTDTDESRIAASPNPFSTITKIQIPASMLAGGNCLVQVMNSSGQVIKTFQISEDTFTWDGTDDDGNEVSRGIYFILLKSINTVKKLSVSKM